VGKRKVKAEKREMIEKHYHEKLKSRVMEALKIVVARKYEADVLRDGVMARSHFQFMVSEWKRRVGAREAVELAPGINHWSQIVFKHVLSEWRIKALVARRDRQGDRLAVGFHRSMLLKKAMNWLIEYREIRRKRKLLIVRAVELHSNGLIGEAFMRWVEALELGSEMRLASLQVCFGCLRYSLFMKRLERCWLRASNV
jgi:hypothetical protein